MSLISVDGFTPDIDASAWVAANATLVGDVVLGEGASVFYSCVVRADSDRITIGAGTNIQDGCVVHADPGFPVNVGSGVSVGHRAVLHGCTVEDNVLIGMGAVLLNGARIGSGSLIAAGAVVLEGAVIPPDSLVAGVPAKVRRDTADAERAHIVENAVGYRRLAATNAKGEAAALAGES